MTAATVMAALVAVAASACGGATTATGPRTNGLEEKSAGDVLQAAAAALRAAKSVHIVATNADGLFDLRMQGRSATGTLTLHGAQIRITIIGRGSYAETDQAGLKNIGVPEPVQRYDARRWIKLPSPSFTGLAIANFASGLTSYYGALTPKVHQATFNGRKVVVVSWRNGSKLQVANTGLAYPLHAEFKGQHPARIDFSEYNAPLHITAPANPIDVSNAG